MRYGFLHNVRGSIILIINQTWMIFLNYEAHLFKEDKSSNLGSIVEFMVLTVGFDRNKNVYPHFIVTLQCIKMSLSFTKTEIK